jgi:Type IV secretion system pilin
MQLDGKNQKPIGNKVPKNHTIARERNVQDICFFLRVSIYYKKLLTYDHTHPHSLVIFYLRITDNPGGYNPPERYQHPRYLCWIIECNQHRAPGFYLSDQWVLLHARIEAFTVIAFQIKNVVIILAVIFLVIAVIKLLFSPNSEEDVKKWRNSIIWVSVGIFVMQIAFSAWSALLLKDVSWGIDSRLGWAIWLQIFAPIVGLLQMLASFAFLAMVIYAFFTIVTGAGDEEKMKKWRRTIIYGLIGYFLMKLPQVLIGSLYGTPNCQNTDLINISSCEIANQNITGTVGLIGKIITYVNGFLMLACVILVIYAGWLVLISAGDEEKLKKAKSTILYVLIGFIVLVASHAIFRFFILQG